MLWQYITTLCHRATASPGPQNSQCQIKTYNLFHCPNSRLKGNQNYLRKSIYQCLQNDIIPWAAKLFKEFPGKRTEHVPRVSLQLEAHSEQYLGHHPCSYCRRSSQERAAASLPCPAHTADLPAEALFLLPHVCLHSCKHTENIKRLAWAAQQSSELC